MASSGRRLARWFHTSGTLVSEKGKLKRDMRALYLEECGHEPSPRQLRRWARLKNIELARTAVMGTGGEAA